QVLARRPRGPAPVPLRGGSDVAYPKLVSASPTDLLHDDPFRLSPVAARFPHNQSGQVRWQPRPAGAYDCRRELAEQPENALMTITSLLRYLIGNRQAILEIAASPPALPGNQLALFVLPEPLPSHPV